MRTGYLDPNTIEELEEGKTVAWYVDEDGDEIADVEFDKGDKIPETMQFESPHLIED